MDKIESLNYLWTTEKEKHYIEILNDIFYIMDINNMMLLIEDDSLYLLIIEKMISNGVKVVMRDKDTQEVVIVSPKIAMEKYNIFKQLRF